MNTCHDSDDSSVSSDSSDDSILYQYPDLFKLPGGRTTTQSSVNDGETHFVSRSNGKAVKSTWNSSQSTPSNCPMRSINSEVIDLSLAPVAIAVNVGDMGYTFRKEFHSGWFTGTVKEIRPLAKGGKYRRCVYDDGDSEDLSLIELQTLAKLDPNVTKQNAIGVSSSSKGKAAKAKVTALAEAKVAAEAEAARIAEEMRPRVSGLNEVATPPPKKQVVHKRWQQDITRHGIGGRFIGKYVTMEDTTPRSEDKENQINIGCGSAPGGFGNSNQPMDATQQPQHLLLSVAACRIQARVRGFAVRLMLRRIAGNDDDSDATIPFDVDDEDLLQRRSLVAEPDVDQADNDDDSEVTRCESVGSCSFDLPPLDDTRYYDTGESVGQLLGLAVVFVVGAAVGDLLGPAVGFAVSAFVGGIVEHAAGGAVVGDWVGIEVGLAVGAAVGDLLGPAAGLAFGTVVGGTVGPSAGTVFGALVGDLLSNW